MDFVKLVRRAENLLAYGQTKAEIRTTFIAEGVDPELIFFAICGAQVKPAPSTGYPKLQPVSGVIETPCLKERR